MARLLRMKDAAEYLAVSLRQVYRLIAQGELPKAVKVGSSSRVPLDELEAYVERQKRQRNR